jgi:hypothetical protein
MYLINYGRIAAIKLMLALRLFGPQQPIRYFCRYFSTSQERNRANLIPLSHDGQRAVWSYKIIQTIIKGVKPESIHDPTLRDKLLELHITDQPFDLDENIRKESLSIFTKGVDLNHHPYTKYLHNGDATDPQTLVFCPNSITTTIF